jgi:hypothetical protein
MNANTTSGSVAVLADPQQLTPGELEQARVYLQQTGNYVVGATKGLSDAQWYFKPTPECWSIAELVEHMVAVQELVLGPIREQLAQTPASAVSPDHKQVDGLIIHQFPGRQNKFQAPEPVRPSGQLEPLATCQRLLKNCGRLTEYLESTPDLRHHLRESPPLKAVSKGAFELMDGYQWVLAAAAHTERHTKQILEVKADAGFPAN